MKLYFKEGKGTAFWPGVKSGSKTHTCRRRAAKVGDQLTLICGGESIAATCTGVQRFKTELAPYGPIIIIDGAPVGPGVADKIRKRSGFKTLEAMFDYYGGEFDGFMIHWSNDFYESIH